MKTFSRRAFLASALVLVLVAGLLAGCGGGKAPAEAPAKAPVKITVAHSSSASLGDVVEMLAWESLKGKGYEVTPKFLAKPELAVQALTNGDAQFAAISSPTGMAAVQAGAKIKMVLEHKRNEWSMASRAELTDPKQLDGKRVAIHSEGSITNALVKWTNQKYNIKPTILVIPGSDVRAQALLSGQIDASPLEIQDALGVQAKAPGKFHILIAYSQLFPGLNGTAFWASDDWLAKNPKVVEDLIAANLETRRKAKADPQWLIGEAKRLFPQLDAKLVETVVKAYLQADIWDVNGNLTPQTADFSLKFYSEAGSIKGGDLLKPELYYDFGPLDAALKRLGKQ